eukprot:g4.t1
MRGSRRRLHRSGVAASVTFRFFPLPGGPGLSCDAADDADACALRASGCDGEDGCSGSNAAALASFASCFEGSFKEMLCIGAKTKDKKCISDAGIDASAYASCMSNQTAIKEIQATISAAGSNVHSFPKVTINGKDKSDAAQDPKSLQSALCSAGVKAAC